MSPRPAAHLDDLTEPQREAVLHGDGPLLVVAGPGSGKTRVITRRIAHLISRGINPASILAITFTNKAAQEMVDRVQSMCCADGSWVRTFHSACAAILRRWPDSAGLVSGFSILDRKDQTKLLKEVMSRHDVQTAEMRPNAVLSAISAWKMSDLDPDDARRESDNFRSDTLARLYGGYEKALAESNAVDFDDLLVRTLRAMREEDALLRRLQFQFEYVLIDEYQDTSPVQFQLASLWAARHQNICATGDPDQSIYAFRKADVRNILEFEKNYPDAKVVRLEQNFRSVGNVLKVADELIAHNKARHPKRLFTDKEDGAKVRLTGSGTELDEGHRIAELLLEGYGRGTPYKDMAVFYRTNAQSRAIEAGLRSKGIPYRIVKGVEFYQRVEIKDVLAYLKLLANPRDWTSLDRVLTTPSKGIGAKTQAKIADFARAKGLSPRDALVPAADGAGVSRRAAQALRMLDETFRELEKLSGGPVEDVVARLVTRIRFEDHLKKKYPEDHEERVDNVRELVGSAELYDQRANDDGTLVGFLTEVGLVSDVDGYDAEQAAVPLMTLHTSKGLEFDEVVIAGLEDGLLPHVRSDDDASAIEEERRLLFVGITRARKRLTLSYALDRRAQIGSKNRESRFLDEIPADLLVREGFALQQRSYGAGSLGGGRWSGGEPWASRSRSPSPRRSSWQQQRRAPEDSYGVDASYDDEPSFDVHDDPSEELRVGLRVRHPSFGVGQVRRLMGRGPRSRAVVFFPGRGEKTLSLSHARLTPVPD